MLAFLAFLEFNILYFLARGAIFLLDWFRGLSEDFIQGAAVDFALAAFFSLICVRTYTHTMSYSDHAITRGVKAKYPKLVAILYIILIVASRVLLSGKVEWFFYFSSSFTLEVISVVLISVWGFLGSLSKPK